MTVLTIRIRSRYSATLGHRLLYPSIQQHGMHHCQRNPIILRMLNSHRSLHLGWIGHDHWITSAVSLRVTEFLDHSPWIFTNRNMWLYIFRYGYTNTILSVDRAWVFLAQPQLKPVSSFEASFKNPCFSYSLKPITNVETQTYIATRLWVLFIKEN